MATLFYAVYEAAEQTALDVPLQEGKVTIGGTSLQSAVFTSDGRKRRTVRLFADTDCFVTWGEDPTAVADGTGGRPFGAENPEYISVEAGHRLAVIQRT